MNLVQAPAVSIVVLNWNGWEDTLACLESLATLTYPNFNVVLVDNGSTDDSLAHLRPYAAPYRLTLLENGSNLGFAEGNNVGIRHATDSGADYIFLLNNDAVVGPQTVSRLVEAAETHPDGAFFSPKIYYFSEPEMLWYAGARWNEDWMDFEHIGQKTVDQDENEHVVGTDYASGCAMFVRVEAIRKIGLMDKKFFLTYEESDWCYRGRKTGWKSYLVNGAKVWHKVSASFGGAQSPLQQYFYTRNLLLFGERHLGWLDFARLFRKSVRRIYRLSPPNPAARLPGRFKRTYWNLTTLIRRTRDPVDAASEANILALRDYLLRHFGDCPVRVRQLNQTKNNT